MEVINEIAEWASLHLADRNRPNGLAALSVTSKHFREGSTRCLFKTVYLRPRGKKPDTPSTHPCILPDNCSGAVKTLVCNGRTWSPRYFDVNRVVEAISKFKRLRNLKAVDDEKQSSGLNRVLKHFGNSAAVKFNDLKYIELQCITPQLLWAQKTTVEHLWLKTLPRHTAALNASLLAYPFPKLEFVTLDSHSLNNLRDVEGVQLFCDTIKNIRIIWTAEDLTETGMESNGYETRGLRQRALIPAGRTEKGGTALKLRGVEHLHMDVEQYGSPMGDVEGTLRGLATVVKEIGSELRELVVWITELEVEEVEDYSILGPMLPTTFFSPSLPQLAGVALFLELPHRLAVEQLEDGLMGAQRPFSLRVLEKDRSDIMLSHAPVVITEGKVFGCECEERHKTPIRYYMRRYFGEYLRTYEYINSDV